jgi:hypothetical protein
LSFETKHIAMLPDTAEAQVRDPGPRPSFHLTMGLEKSFTMLKGQNAAALAKTALCFVCGMG